MDNHRKQYKRTWMAAFRKVSAVHNTESMQFGSGSEDDLDDRHNDDTAADVHENNIVKVNVTTPDTEKQVNHSIKADSDVQHAACSWYDYDGYESLLSSDTDGEGFDDNMLSDYLAAWANEFSIKQNAVDSLLRILQVAGHKVPSTARSLLKTTRHVLISEKSGMQYVYLDVNKQLQRFVKTIPEDRLASWNELELSLNIDGLPLFRSSNTCVYGQFFVLLSTYSQ
jgi:hypothetical protein